MGGSQSRTLLEEPWRTIHWDDKESALHYVKSFKPDIEGRKVRILVTGPTGAGKSSFINTVQSVLDGRICRQALSAPCTTDTFTKKYSTYRFHKDNPETYYPFVFNDTMGLSQHTGILVDDIKLALRGHMQDGYTFRPAYKMTNADQHYIIVPSDHDKVCVVVWVIPAHSVNLMDENTLQMIQDINRTAIDLGIPQVVVLTKIDETYPEIQDDLKNVYKVIDLKNLMTNVSEKLGIPVNCIFPVKNYHDEIDTNRDVDSLVLSALKVIINFGKDCINFHNRQP